MKKFKSISIVITVSLFVLLSFQLNAQKAAFGIRFMPTASNFNLKTSSGGTIKGEVNLGFGAGILLGYNFNEHVGINAELMYSTYSQKYTEQNLERKITLRYVNIPLMLSLNSGITKPVNLNITAGPQIGISAGSTFTTKGGDATTTFNSVTIRKGDLGFAYGAGLDVALNPMKTTRFALGFRGVLGLIDISADNNNQVNTSYYVIDRVQLKTYSIYFGFTFLI
jgi:opacity protein-like surface antigen